jgi:hypothetical protein
LTKGQLEKNQATNDATEEIGANASAPSQGYEYVQACDRLRQEILNSCKAIGNHQNNVIKKLYKYSI